jgi:hypothetical protein
VYIEGRLLVKEGEYPPCLEFLNGEALKVFENREKFGTELPAPSIQRQSGLAIFFWILVVGRWLLEVRLSFIGKQRKVQFRKGVDTLRALG